MVPRRILSALFSFRSRNWGNCRTAQRRDGGNTVSTRTRKSIHPNASLSSNYEVAYRVRETHNIRQQVRHHRNSREIWSGTFDRLRNRLEARVGIEPTHKGFADLSLTTWVPRPCSMLRSEPVHPGARSQLETKEIWSGRRDLNPRLRPWQGRTLPLSYSRSARDIVPSAC